MYLLGLVHGARQGSSTGGVTLREAYKERINEAYMGDEEERVRPAVALNQQTALYQDGV